jgi:hypothetical protein
MPAMHTVEIADGHRAAAQLLGECRQVTDQLHSWFRRRKIKSGVTWIMGRGTLAVNAPAVAPGLPSEAPLFSSSQMGGQLL